MEGGGGVETAALMRADSRQLPTPVFSLPSLMFGKILWAYGITPILLGRRGRSESSRIPGEGLDENAFIFRRAGVSLLSQHS